jgi:alkylation response protein AidB-like acyl-CoA dehydrogenase
MALARIASPSDQALDELCAGLARLAVETDKTDAWPAQQLALCGQAGVFEWFLPRDWSGQAWSDRDLVQGYLKLSAACLTTTFIITQRTGACQRIAGSDNEAAKQRWLPGLASETLFATVGISHLTTSRRHLGRPVMRARRVTGGFELDGFSPWVTGGCHADVIVTGAELEDQSQILVALPTSLRGVSTPAPPRLVGVSASHTGEVHCDHVLVRDDCVLQGPAQNVMRLGVGAGTGGLQTSTLAVGLADAALTFLAQEAENRPALGEPTAELRREHRELEAELLAMATGAGSCTNEQLRVRANSLVLRSTQAALAAAKGTGYVVGHPAGRWCREALFFLVWSCPQPVLTANLCELAGIESL